MRNFTAQLSTLLAIVALMFAACQPDTPPADDPIPDDPNPENPLPDDPQPDDPQPDDPQPEADFAIEFEVPSNRVCMGGRPQHILP